MNYQLSVGFNGKKDTLLKISKLPKVSRFIEYDDEVVKLTFDDFKIIIDKIKNKKAPRLRTNFVKDDKVKIQITDFTFATPDGITGLYKNPLHILQGFSNKYKKVLLAEFDSSFTKRLTLFKMIANANNSDW